MCSACRGQREAAGTLKPELSIVVNCHEGSGDCISLLQDQQGLLSVDLSFQSPDWILQVGRTGESIIVRGKGRVWVIQSVKCLSRELRPCSKAREGTNTGIIQGSAYVKLIMNINMALCDGQIWFVGGYYRSLG